MLEAQALPVEHRDLVHDVAYNFYGERMATCSSDQMVKVWDKDLDGVWKPTASWVAHSGSIWKVTWAHPEFGQVLATCSFDRSAAIWEESCEINGSGEPGTKQWLKKTSLVLDTRASVTDIKFGPKTLGLLIAMCASDGIIRIYEALDVMNLAQWTLQHEIPTKTSLTCISWNPSLSRAHPPMLAAGSEDSSRLTLLEYSETARRWTRMEPTGSWPAANDPVHDIAFAPNLGRSYHLLAIASNQVRIVSLKPLPEGGGRYISEIVANLDLHNSPAWRVSWNVTGTILASSGDDATVRLWKMQYQRQWVCVATIRGEGGNTNRELQMTSGIPVASLPASSIRYCKLGTIANPNQVPWH